MNCTLRATAAAALVVGLAAASPAMAQTTEAEQNAEIEALKEAIQDLQIKLKGLEAQQAAQAEAQAGKSDESKITVGPGLSISKAGKSAGLTGRLHWDVGLYPTDVDLNDFDTGTNLRRGRLGVKGEAGGFSYNLTVDVGGSSVGGNEIEIDEAAIYYSPSKMIKVGFGKMKIPVTFEESTSSNDISFIERSMPVDMFTDKTLGPKAVNAQVWVYGKQSLVEAAIHAQNYTTREGLGGGAEDLGVTFRGVFAPIKTKTSAVHIGGWVDRSEGPYDAARWGYRTELNVANAKLLHGSSEKTINGMLHYGLELAYLNGPFWAQAEYINGTIEKPSDADVEGDGYYVQAGYVIGGAKRYNMKKGAWSAPKVKSPFPGKGSGVVEVAGRYSLVDFGDDTSSTHHGKQSNFTLGLNWYLTNNTRIMFNSIHVDLEEAKGDAHDDPVTEDFWVHGMRWQYKW
ncbi:MAG: porin [Rhodospirillales bacterium]|nr:porin [Rhodospirillales bacterium]